MTQRILTEAEKEAIYDAERRGVAYVKPEQDDAEDTDLIIEILRSFTAKPEPAGADVELEIAQEVDAFISAYQAGYAAGRSAAIQQIQAFLDSLPEPQQ